MAGAGKRLLWAPSAEQDLHNIWRHFARVASEDIADKNVQIVRVLHERRDFSATLKEDER